MQLDIVPATIQAISISAEKYACGCGHCILARTMDEPPVQVLNEAGRSAQRKSYRPLQRGGLSQQTAVLHPINPGWGAGVDKCLLLGFFERTPTIHI